MSGELKPCPFCGSKKVRSNLYGRECKLGQLRTLYYVYCENCAAQGTVITGEKVEPGEKRWSGSKKHTNAASGGFTKSTIASKSRRPRRNGR